MGDNYDFKERKKELKNYIQNQDSGGCPVETYSFLLNIAL